MADTLQRDTENSRRGIPEKGEKIRWTGGNF